MSTASTRVACRLGVRVLILSWEYPPIVEGGLARHVRKLSEQLVAPASRSHVVTRGGGRLSESEDRHGVAVHRVREPDFPKDDLDAFIAWVDHMNADMLAAALELDGSFDLVHSHDWLVADAARALARRFGVPVAGDRARDRVRPPPGLGRQASAVVHPRASSGGWCATADRVITCSHYMRGQVADVFGVPAGARDRDPERDRPDRPAAGRRPPRLRAQFAAPDEKLVLLVGRLVYEKGFHLALDAMPRLIERLGGVRFLVAGSGRRRPSSRRRPSGWR